MATIIRRKRRENEGWPNLLAPFEDLHGEVHRLLDRFPGRGLTAPLVGAYPVDVWEDNEHVYVAAEMPGVDKKDVHITLENGILTISGEKKSEERSGEDHVTERFYGRIERAFTVPTTVDEEKVKAKLTDGVLNLTLDKKPEAQPRKIEVS